MKRHQLLVTLAVLFAVQAMAQQPQCQEYSYKASDNVVSTLLDETEKATVEVGDWQEIQKVVLKTKLLVKKFNGVKIALKATPPAGTAAGRKDTVVLKKLKLANAEFFKEHRKPLKLEITWDDDAPMNLHDALHAMSIVDRQTAKRQYVQITAKPDVSLRSFALGTESSATNGGSRGTWELDVQNKGMLAQRRQHVKLTDWSLTLCLGRDPLETSAGLEEQFVNALQQQELGAVALPGTGVPMPVAAPIPVAGGGLFSRGAGRGMFGGAGLMRGGAGAGGLLGGAGGVGGMFRSATAGLPLPMQYAFGYMTGMTYLALGRAIATSVTTGTPLLTALGFPYYGMYGYGGFGLVDSNITTPNDTIKLNETSSINITLSNGTVI